MQTAAKRPIAEIRIKRFTAGQADELFAPVLGSNELKLRVTGAALILPMLFMAAGPAFAEASVPAPASAPPSASVAPVSSLVPADFNVPTLVETADFKIVPLGPELAKVDFEAYMSSIEHLQQTFTRSTGWPHKDISDADAMADMEA